MPNSKPFPSKEADLNLYFQAAVPYLVANATRLGVSSAQQTKISTQLVSWNTVYPASQNNNTRTKSIVDNKDIAKENLMATLRTVYADIPASALTVEDRNTLNIASRSTSRTPSPVPTTKPIAQVDTSKRLQHTVSFTNEDGTLAKPEGVRGCQIWFKIGEPALDPSELSYMATDSASPYIYTFDGETAGKNVYYWLRWENTRGKTGPWSDVVMATVTG
jgi:hypothetical protein